MQPHAWEGSDCKREVRKFTELREHDGHPTLPDLPASLFFCRSRRFPRSHAFDEAPESERGFALWQHVVVVFRVLFLLSPYWKTEVVRED